MKKKLISILSICSLVMLFLGFAFMHPITVNADASNVYVSSSGSDSGAGTNASPYATLDKALTMVTDGGTITLKNTITVGSWAAHNKTVTITGGGLNVSGMAEFTINDNVTFTSVSWTVDAPVYSSTTKKDESTRIYANGHTMTFGTGISWSNNVDLYGGAVENQTVASTNLTVLSGTYEAIYGGGYHSTVSGNTNLTVGGTVNNTSAVETAISNHSGHYYIYGGGRGGTISGKTNLTVNGNAKAVYVYGGSNGYGSVIGRGSNLLVTGGKFMSVCGGTSGGNSGSGTNTRIEGGAMQQVFGGNENFTLTGNVDLRIVGGTVTRRIYAGNYDANYSRNYFVSGKINLELGGNVDINFTNSNSDKCIYARSRQDTDGEDCQIVFTSQYAYDTYKNKLGAYDYGASYVMGSVSAADSYHYYTYTANGSVITQRCAYHSGLAATATLSLDDNVSLQYTGSEIKPAVLTFSNTWEYDKPTIVYENNVDRGAATASVTVAGTTVSKQFVIVDAPVLLGASVRIDSPCGLRFQSKVPSDLVGSGATFGTLFIPKDVLGENELTVSTLTVRNVAQTKWVTDNVRDNFPAQYEDGYEYFNAVLTGIPESHYDKVIVARSYVCANGKYYYSDPIERSVAQVAAYVLREGYQYDVLYDYVDKALEGSVVSMETSATVNCEETYQLSLSGNKGLVAIWSSNSDIISIDNNGLITATRNEGTAVVTARLGNLTVTCTVTVKFRWTGFY